MTRIVGLTGGIACGKSTVTNVLVAEGIAVLDCDLISREVVEPGRPAYNKIVGAFGEGVLQADGTLDRAKMRKLVFDDPAKRKLLMGAIGGAIQRELFQRITKLWLVGERVVVVDAPTLFETKMERICAEVVVVATSPDVQLKRLVQRDGSSVEDAQKIIDAQLPVSTKVERASRVLWNDGPIEEVEDKASECVLP